MTILAIDAANPLTSVALGGERLLYVRAWAPGRRLAEQLAPEVANALTAWGKAAADLDGIAVTTGPGSFTAIRIALALAKGLALAANRRLVGVGSLEVMAHSAPASDGTICPIVPLGADRFGVASFQCARGEIRRLKPDIAVRREALLEFVPSDAMIVGEGIPDGTFSPSRQIMSTYHCRPGASVLAELGRKCFSKSSIGDIHEVVPNYLRASSPEEWMTHQALGRGK